jgi:hypothetical protein
VPDQNPSAAALLLRLIGGDPRAVDDVLALAGETDDPSVLVAAGILTQDHAYLGRARAGAATVRDRQLVVLAQALLERRTDRFDALVRDHLADHPDHLLAAWIAGRSPPPTVPAPTTTVHRHHDPTTRET